MTPEILSPEESAHAGMPGRPEVTHVTTVSYDGQEVEVYGWQSRGQSKWILTVRILETGFPEPWNGLAVPATVEADDFETATQLAAEVGMSRYHAWRSEING